MKKKLKISMMIIIIIGIFLLCTGCVALIEQDANQKHVRGFGVDCNFYPFPSIRFGLYEYVLMKK